MGYSIIKFYVHSHSSINNSNVLQLVFPPILLLLLLFLINQRTKNITNIDRWPL